MNVWIGTAGYSYPHWVGRFYPPRTPARRLLTHYARHFPLVELNFTFYRTPTAESLVRLADRTPAGFQFAVKLPKSLTHDRRPEELGQFREAVAALHAQGRLAGTVAQFPQAAHNTPAARRWLVYLGRELAGLRLAVEFRHVSWSDMRVPAWREGHGVGLIAVDVPELPLLYPCGLVCSGRRIHVRFHSRNPAAWYGSDVERHDYDYSDAECREWAAALRNGAGAADEAVLVFCNCVGTQGLDSARRMAAAVAECGPELAVVEPFAAAVPQQRSLFE
ncbi:MAG TPA: DUF72 domain-containing protein [Gemmataceae bacterium]|jgi:uncharacterized protein YecE (DUF72 family)